MPIVVIHQAPKEVIDVTSKIILIILAFFVFRYVYHLLDQVLFLYHIKKIKKKYYKTKEMLDAGEISDKQFDEILNEIADSFENLGTKGKKFSNELSAAIENVASDIKKRYIKPPKTQP